MAPESDGPWTWSALRLAGAGLLVATGGIHLDLYVTGYRTIPTIGWLFLLQVIAAWGLAGLVVVAPATGLPAAAGALFALSTLGGYLLSLRVGLFGFREVRTTAGVVAGTIEIVAFAALAASASASLVNPRRTTPRHRLGRWARGPRGGLALGYWASGAVTVLAAVLLAVSLEDSGPVPSRATSSSPVLKAATVHGASIVTDTSGLTLYWFVPDTPTKSTCYGTCAVYWPPVIGRPVAGAGISAAKLATVERSGGVSQATYDGHPLYTYVGDSGPGQANGNDIDLNGGVWHQMDVSG